MDLAVRIRDNAKKNDFIAAQLKDLPEWSTFEATVLKKKEDKESIVLGSAVGGFMTDDMDYVETKYVHSPAPFTYPQRQ